MAVVQSSDEDAWFTGLFFTALTVALYMLFFATWTDIVGWKVRPHDPPHTASAYSLTCCSCFGLMTITPIPTSLDWPTW